jgi:hypothetical protein
VFRTPSAAVELAHGERIHTQVVVDDLAVDITVAVPSVVAIFNLPTMGTLADLRRPLSQGAEAAHLVAKVQQKMELWEVPVSSILGALSDLRADELIPGVAYSLEGRWRKSIEPPLNKVGIALLDELPAPSASITGNALARTEPPEDVLLRVEPAQSILHEIERSVVMRGVRRVEKELKESARTPDGAIEHTTLSGGGAAQGVAQHRQKEGGHPLQLLAGPMGHLTVGPARCSHGAIGGHRKPHVVEALKALMLLEAGLQPRQEM